MARPTLMLTDDQVREVETLAALLNQEQIADYFGMSRRSFLNILSRDEDVAAQYKRGKAKAIAHVANGLLQKARAGDTTSAIFYLKTQAGWREKTSLEVTADTTPSTGARDALAALMDQIADRKQRIGVSAPSDGKVIDAQPVQEEST